MSFLIFSILLILSIWAVVWCVLKFLGQQVRYDFDTVHLRQMPRDENVARRLNAIWNRDPRDGRDDPTGYKKCMVFLHAFDYQNGRNTEGGGWDGACRVSSNCPWCPCVRGQVHPKFLNLIGITHFPSTSLSFSAFNRHITRDGKIVFATPAWSSISRIQRTKPFHRYVTIQPMVGRARGPVAGVDPLE